MPSKSIYMFIIKLWHSCPQKHSSLISIFLFEDTANILPEDQFSFYGFKFFFFIKSLFINFSGSKRTKWSNVSQNINSRSQYEDVITRNITVHLSGFCSGNSHAIAEFKVTGRFAPIYIYLLYMFLCIRSDM